MRTYLLHSLRSIFIGNWVVKIGDIAKVISGKINAKSYMKTLEEGLQQILESAQSDTLVFQQNNSPNYTSRMAEKWLEDHVLEVLKWPPYSPGLNPIEKVWTLLKDKAHKIIKSNKPLSGSSDFIHQKLAEYAQKVWDQIDWSIMQPILESMPQRVNKCIKAKRAAHLILIKF